MTQLNITLIILILAIVFLPKAQPSQFLGNVLNSVYENNNGILTFHYKPFQRIGTSTPCSIKSPNSTSTIVHASIDIQTAATSSPLLIEIGKATHSGATTTLLGQLTLAAGAKGALVATSSLNTNDNLIIAPSNYVNFRYGFISGYSNAPAGSCEVIFKVL